MKDSYQHVLLALHVSTLSSTCLSIRLQENQILLCKELVMKLSSRVGSDITRSLCVTLLLLVCWLGQLRVDHSACKSDPLPFPTLYQYTSSKQTPLAANDNILNGSLVCNLQKKMSRHCLQNSNSYIISLYTQWIFGARYCVGL